ncbi:hypothetical protein VP01_457g7 [Puccinia sorghi]|uniref:Uncharacterized protein n=1 Tax=Puccinia sorghi TaxID=27349 RepID=A0A0L6UNL5_9BASI|nr:hypothetical protein VP01_457g7 [Puccinia sorghi]
MRCQIDHYFPSSLLTFSLSLSSSPQANLAPSPFFHSTSEVDFFALYHPAFMMHSFPLLVVLLPSINPLLIPANKLPAEAATKGDAPPAEPTTPIKQAGSLELARPKKLSRQAEPAASEAERPVPAEGPNEAGGTCKAKKKKKKKLSRPELTRERKMSSLLNPSYRQLKGREQRSSREVRERKPAILKRKKPSHLTSHLNAIACRSWLVSLQALQNLQRSRYLDQGHRWERGTVRNREKDRKKAKKKRIKNKRLFFIYLSFQNTTTRVDQPLSTRLLNQIVVFLNKTPSCSRQELNSGNWQLQNIKVTSHSQTYVASLPSCPLLNSTKIKEINSIVGMPGILKLFNRQIARHNLKCVLPGLEIYILIIAIKNSKFDKFESTQEKKNCFYHCFLFFIPFFSLDYCRGPRHIPCFLVGRAHPSHHPFRLVFRHVFFPTGSSDIRVPFRHRFCAIQCQSLTSNLTGQVFVLTMRGLENWPFRYSSIGTTIYEAKLIQYHCSSNACKEVPQHCPHHRHPHSHSDFHSSPCLEDRSDCLGRVLVRITT